MFSNTQRGSAGSKGLRAARLAFWFTVCWRDGRHGLRLLCLSYADVREKRILLVGKSSNGSIYSQIVLQSVARARQKPGALVSSGVLAGFSNLDDDHMLRLDTAVAGAQRDFGPSGARSDCHLPLLLWNYGHHDDSPDSADGE